MTDLRAELQSSLGAAYTIARELGGGGMSRVFVAEDTSLNHKVVVKVLSPELAAGVSADRFTREIQLAARLQQADIVLCSPPEAWNTAQRADQRVGDSVGVKRVRRIPADDGEGAARRPSSRRPRWSPTASANA